MCFSALSILIVGVFTAHFLSGSTPHFRELVDDSFTFSSLAQSRCLWKWSLRKTSGCLTLFPRCVFLYCLIFFKVLFKNWKQCNITKICKKRKISPTMTPSLPKAISSPFPFFTCIAFCLVMSLFLSRSSNTLSCSRFPVFFLILASFFGFWSWITEMALQFISFLSQSLFYFPFPRPKYSSF